jgi:hypothetical protein
MIEVVKNSEFTRNVQHDENGVPVPTGGWVVTASADNAAATATRAAEAGKTHHITAVFASFSGAATQLLQIKDGAAVIAEQYVYSSAVITLPKPIEVTEGNAVSAVLAASGGLGVLGKVNLSGFTM